MTPNKIALLQVADTSPLESIVMMLHTAGYSCHLPDDSVRRMLQACGCDTVLDIDHLVSRMGYEKPIPLPYISHDQMDRVDLYVDVKGHRNGPKVIKRWPHLEGKILWYRINGGMPEHVINDRGDHGDEVNPPCPVITPNQWYSDEEPCPVCCFTGGSNSPICKACNGWQDPWHGGNAYTMWPPFYRINLYGPRSDQPYTDPVCLIHGINGWGYGKLIPSVRQLGVKCHGINTPDGLLEHRQVRELLKTTQAVVHLKSSDAPGYALYEAMASGCPVICTRRLIWRCKMQDLLEPGKTCLVFDRETHDELTDEDVLDCTAEVKAHLDCLQDPIYNLKIGGAGRQRLHEIMWNRDNEEDVQSLHGFLQRVIR